MLLEFDEVSLRRGARLVLAGISLRVHAGEKLGLVGRNGSGKTSVLELVTDKLHADIKLATDSDREMERLYALFSAHLDQLGRLEGGVLPGGGSWSVWDDQDGWQR